MTLKFGRKDQDLNFEHEGFQLPISYLCGEAH